MKRIPITGVTVSLEVKHMEYGAGSGRFCSLRADLPEGGTTGLDFDEALLQSIEMHQQAWESVLSAEVAEKVISSTEFTERITAVRTRFAKLKALMGPEATISQTDKKENA